MQIRAKFLPDPDDGLTMMTKRLRERVDGRDKARALLSQAGVLPEKVMSMISSAILA